VPSKFGQCATFGKYVIGSPSLLYDLISYVIVDQKALRLIEVTNLEELKK
jgi:hypothetical protein